MKSGFKRYNMSDIFLSYKSEDKERAIVIAEALELKGYSVWWDRVIPPGRTFDEVIEEELACAKCVIVLWSRKSVLSDWVKEEADRGKERKILVPILIEDVEIPMGFGRIQAARLIDWQATLPNPEFDLLLNSITKIVGRSPTQKEEKKELKTLARREISNYKKILIVIGVLGLILAGYFIYHAQMTGSVSVSSSPSGAGIYLDGSYRGITPMKINIARGSYTITLKLAGYQDFSQTVRVNVREIAFVSSSLTSISTPKPMVTSTKTTIVPSTLSVSPALNIEFVLIQPGEFDMGSPDREVGRYDNEGPVHHVKFTKAFKLGKYEVTQKQWRDIMGTDPSFFKGDDLPVESVSWKDVSQFIMKLNAKEGTTKYRLPTEAEWEYAARAGTNTRFSTGDDESKLGDFEWYNANSMTKTHPVGQKKPNSWGLFDMYGNVREWVQDEWHDNYKGAPTDGSPWESGANSLRVVRGCSFSIDASGCRAAVRGSNGIGDGSDHPGFRIVRD